MEYLSRRRLMGGWTDLHVAADSGDLARARIAVQKSPADVDRMTKDRQTALHLASAAGFEAVVGELLDRGARSTLQDEAGCGLMLVATRAGHTHLLPLLAPACGLEQRDPASGATPLHAAAAAGQLDPLQWLLAAGANCATRDNSGRTPGEAALAAGQHAAARAIREATLAAAAAGRPPPPLTVPGGSGGGAPMSPISPVAVACAPFGPGPSYGAPYGHPYGRPPYDHSVLQPQSPHGLAAGASATPWQQAPPAPPPQPAAAAGRLQVPETLPAPVYYPTPPPGAGVYY
ncbi:hypothetical protein GPECTOR_116g344 [Gonium pectorale]|uniref:Uncharacterized protein n=1 Tax=Gonium pectorale TaxID=33097 RepID=A0A150FYY2_GONPE|nr:hypothetical protein GPECTOR_116g344 [Gonium pectorale]|eukprot:KXZ42812.1 hypothetical protein GPECTOR_116g344 [Gonium pectorale]